MINKTIQDIETTSFLLLNNTPSHFGDGDYKIVDFVDETIAFTSVFLKLNDFQEWNCF